MAQCDSCGTTIIFGGKRDGAFRYCNDKCRKNSEAVRALPFELVKQEIDQIHRGACPRCQGHGPVDVHHSHRVISVVVLTFWKTIPQISCRGCALKSQVGNTLISFFFGWWGFPFGLILTPVQLIRNVIAMASGPDPRKPSPDLEKMVRLYLGANAPAPAVIPPPIPR